MADLSARSSGRVYAYEGLHGPRAWPHNADYVKDNVKALADWLVALRDGADGPPASNILIHTYSFGGIAAQAAIQELAARKDANGASELSKFKHIDLVALLPPTAASRWLTTFEKYPRFWSIGSWSL